VLFSSFEDVIREIAPFTKGKTVIDLTSSKGEPVAIMHRHLKEANVLGTHPLFGPKADDTNQNFILTPTNEEEEKTAEGFAKWLEERGFHVSRMNPEKHDEIMSIALALSHFVGIAVGETWMDFDFGELRKAMPSSFKRLLGLVENISESDPDFYANLQVILPHVVAAEEKFVRNAQRLQEMVKMRDEKGFAKEMKRLSDSVHAAERADKGLQ
jgi:prephenate dehydrogenase